MTILSVPGQVIYRCAANYPKLSDLKLFYFISHLYGSGIQTGLCWAVLQLPVMPAETGVSLWGRPGEFTVPLLPHPVSGKDG